MAARPFQPHVYIRAVDSNPLGFAAPLESAARARSAPLLACAKPLDFARALKLARVCSTPSGARSCRSCPFGSAAPLDLTARAARRLLDPHRARWSDQMAGRVCSVLWEQLNRLLAFGVLGTIDFVVIKSCGGEKNYSRTLCSGCESL